ncbi:MAG: AraC family transcriptional regulator [Acidobacteriota bacterium]
MADQTPLGGACSLRRIGPFSLWESRQPPGFEVAAHYHRHPSLCLVLDGGYHQDSASPFWVGRGMAVLASPSAGGGMRFGPEGARTLLIEGPEEAWGDVLGFGKLPAREEVRDDVSGLALALAVHLPAAREARILDLVVEMAAMRAQESRASGPLPRSVRDALAVIEDGLREGALGEDGLGEGWTLSSLAAAVGVNRVTLARGFRRHLGTTVGEYLRTRRLGRAAERIARGEALAAVAGECGFADQSHLTRHFHRRFGVSPARFRRRLMAVPDGAV